MLHTILPGGIATPDDYRYADELLYFHVLRCIDRTQAIADELVAFAEHNAYPTDTISISTDVRYLPTATSTNTSSQSSTWEGPADTPPSIAYVYKSEPNRSASSR
ncbi:hypothetical protein LEM8419_03186 [Neolewinella maritima]|uniref:Uncharacterized protein n=1 Tax=Neolewinella maritima TaxID=1383882 RepID=A0ABN8FBA2_9BACT|nr:hypothetical protein [Neolewinella maritima]CAH1002267.1 hypothetical protein LEM8419_03186 [Neolewinella maritima]